MKDDEQLFLRNYRNVIDLQNMTMIPTERDRIETAHRRLAAAMIISAFADLVNPETKHFERMRARLFFDSGRFRIWADLLEIPHDLIMSKYRKLVYLKAHEWRRVS